MDLENVTQPLASFREEAARLGGTLAREGRVLGARALRQGSSQLQRTAIRLDALATQLDAAPEAAAPEAAPAHLEVPEEEAVASAQGPAAQMDDA